MRLGLVRLDLLLVWLLLGLTVYSLDLVSVLELVWCFGIVVAAGLHHVSLQQLVACLLARQVASLLWWFLLAAWCWLVELPYYYRCRVVTVAAEILRARERQAQYLKRRCRTSLFDDEYALAAC